MIGYYVHHQGAGHLERMRAIAAHLTVPMAVLSSLPAGSGDPDWVRLADDDTGSHFPDPTANGTLHWAPHHHPGVRSRMAVIAAWIARNDPDLMVVDVSVEVAGLCRLLGVPTVVVAMRGDRTDRPHRAAYDGAHALLAPWAAEFGEPDWPQSWRDKTFHTGAISRFADREPPIGQQRAGRPRVLVLWGSGGGRSVRRLVEQARSTVPSWSWRLAGGPEEDRIDRGEVWDLLAEADVVVTHGGQNAIAEVAAAGKPAIVIADGRPHGEQIATAAALNSAGIATGLPGWPAPDRWADLLTEAVARGGSQWPRWAPRDSARRAAAFLQDTADVVRPLASTPATGRSATDALTTSGVR